MSELEKREEKEKEIMLELYKKRHPDTNWEKVSKVLSFIEELGLTSHHHYEGGYGWEILIDDPDCEEED